MDYALYIASVLGAVALLLTMPRAGFSPAKLGALIGVATLGGLWLYLARALPPVLGLPGEKLGMAYYYIFSGLSLIAAVRVITHTKPVYSALWFVLVVLSSAGLFLLLGAEFMAFALVIIYGGAILVTYVFVIMLASYAEDELNVAKAAVTEYDKVAREPLAAIAAGFFLLAVLLSVAFTPLQRNEKAAARTDSAIILETLTNRPPQRFADAMRVDKGVPTEAELLADEKIPQGLFPTDRLDNVERVGVQLFAGHPLGLELAGVILLVSLVGAVVIARLRANIEPETVPATPAAPVTSRVEPKGEPGPDSPQTLESVSGGRLNV